MAQAAHALHQQNTVHLDLKPANILFRDDGSVIVMGAATYGLKTQRFVATVPIKVAVDAPCTVILVKQALPFEQLGFAASAPKATGGYSNSDADGHSSFGDDAGPIG